MNNAITTLEPTLFSMKASFALAPAPTAKERIHRLNQLHNGILDYKALFIEAINKDFGGRASAETLLTEILPLLEGIHYAKKRVKRWMKPSKRKVPFMLLGSSAAVHYQPVGVVGILSPWNFPLLLTLSPLVGALAAGNRAMLKTSEFCPYTSSLIQKMIAEQFKADEVVSFDGDVEMATAFTSLPFDHLVFTGSTPIGKKVMQAAANNLTPVTLELGGKSPAIIQEDFAIEEAAKRLALGKAINAGQACVSPDYLLIQEDQVDHFVTAFTQAITRNYPYLESNPDYSAIINDRQRERLKHYLIDATEKGASIITINPASEKFDDSDKLPISLITNVSDDMLVMQEEIFGPLLPIVMYKTLQDAIDYVNKKPRPLSLYYFDWDKKRSKTILNQTHSGGAGINDVMTQVMVDDMPFGGIGPSGMGHYHGKEGFLSFSKAKGVIHKGRIDTTALIAAPWGNTLYKGLMALQFFRFRKIK